MKRIYVKWFGETQSWTESTKNEFALFLNSSNHVQVVNDESEADIILIYNKHLTPTRRFEVKILASAYFRDNANRILIYDETDNPTFVLPGLYVSTDSRSCSSHVLPVPYMHSKLEANFRYQGVQKSITCSFWGRNSHPVRTKIYRISDRRLSVVDTSNYNFFDMSDVNQTSLAKRRNDYLEILQSSMYSLCPRGYGSCSIRLFESLFSQAVPVILSDEYLPPQVFDWTTACIRVPEADVANILAILESDTENYVRRRNYIRDVAAPALTSNCISSYISSALPLIDTKETYVRFYRSIARRLASKWARP